MVRERQLYWHGKGVQGLSEECGALHVRIRARLNQAARYFCLQVTVLHRIVDRDVH